MKKRKMQGRKVGAVAKAKAAKVSSRADSEMTVVSETLGEPVVSSFIDEDDDEQETGDGDEGLASDELEMAGGFAPIVETVLIADPKECYDEIMKSLQLPKGASRVDYGTLLEELDNAQAMAANALRLVATAKRTYKSYEAEADVIRASIRKRAVEIAEKDKARPTKDDIEAIMRSTYHDEYRTLQVKVEEAKSMISVLEGLVTVTRERAKDLRQMLASSRS